MAVHDLDEHRAALGLALLLRGVSLQGGSDTRHQGLQLRQVDSEQTCMHTHVLNMEAGLKF